MHNFFKLSFSYWLAVFASLVLWSREWEILRLGAVKQEEDLFGIFAFCVFCAITLVLFIEIKSWKVVSNEALALVGIPYLVCLFFLSQLTEFRSSSWDYEQYESAFRAIVDETNPYLGNRYLYPPVFADAMAFVYRIGLRVFSWLSIGKSEWIFVFYIHQSALLFSLLLSYVLSIVFAKQIGLKDFHGVILVSVVYLFNVPILRTISYNQVNFYILASILLVLILLQKHPFLAGIFATLGGLIKLYPFVLSVPLFFMKKRQALAGMVFAFLFVMFIQTDFFHDFELWKQFYDFYLAFPIEQESLLFRNSSPMSFLRSTFTFLGFPDNFVSIVFTLIILVVLIWFSIRFYQREKIIITNDALPMSIENIRNIGHLLDFSVISLLIAPSAWEHHYVIAIPLTIWAVAMRGKDAPIQTVISFVLVFTLPVFNIYPFSYVRLVGIVLLLILISPHNIKKSILS